MELKQYLKQKRIPITEFAGMINYSRENLHGIMKGNRKAGRKLIKIIIEFTHGEVTEEELLKPYKEQHEETTI